MQQEQIANQRCQTPITSQQVNQLIQNCYYISNIMLPGAHLLQSSNQPFSSNVSPQIKTEQSQQKQTGSKKLLKLHHPLLQKQPKYQQICVELFYFILNCKIRNYIIKFHQKVIVCLEQSNKCVMAVKQIVESKHNLLANQINYFQLFIDAIQQIIRIVQDSINGVRQNVGGDMAMRSEKKIVEDNSSMQKVVRDINKLYKDANEIKNCKEGIGSAYQCFIQLQKCRYLSSRSLLYKIRNRSISIILFKYPVRKENKQKLISSIKIQKKLKAKYQQEKVIQNFNKKQLDDIMRRIRVNFEKYVKQTWIDNPMYVEIIQQNVLGRENVAEESKCNAYDARMIFKAKVRTIEQTPIVKDQNQEEEAQRALKEKQNILQYSIEYNITRSTMSVRLHTHLPLDASNIDILNQQWSTLTFESSVVSVEIGERGQLMKQRKKYLMVKSATNIQPGEPLIQRCLCLMDTVLTGYQCIEDQIKCNGEEGYSGFKLNQLEDVYKKINHYVNIMREVNFNMINNV